jgi:glutathione synthase/RimK-type ligase-like ATP-grasp enzyme
MRIAFLTYGAFPDLAPDDQIAALELREHGVHVTPVIWDETDPGALAQYDMTVVRSIWNYHEHARTFRVWLDTVKTLNIPLLNPPELISWNSTKKYLSELNRMGDVPIVPTRWVAYDDPRAVQTIEAMDWDRIVIKPEISGSANHTYLTQRENISKLANEILKIQERCDIMVQPFCDSVSTAGEYSLIYFNGKDGFEYSHAVLKTPKGGDFRVQEEWGGTIVPGESPKEYQTAAEKALAFIPGTWLYARVDVILYEESPCIAELELIEPHLYFRADPKAAGRFAKALLSHLGRDVEESVSSGYASIR